MICLVDINWQSVWDLDSMTVSDYREQWFQSIANRKKFCLGFSSEGFSLHLGNGDYCKRGSTVHTNLSHCWDVFMTDSAVQSLTSVCILKKTLWKIYSLHFSSDFTYVAWGFWCLFRVLFKPFCKKSLAIVLI